MFNLKNHPFAVEAFFERSLVLTFAVKPGDIKHLIPNCLDLDQYESHAFIAAAMVQTKDLRIKGAPKFIGKDFFLLGYRVFVRYRTSKGKNLRGLYILKSETDSVLMKTMGNFFTHYNYSTTDINVETEKNREIISSKSSQINVCLESSSERKPKPPSIFPDWKKARRFAGPLPFTFTYNESKKEVLIIEGVRQNWKPEPIKVNSYKLGFLESLDLSDYQLASAFTVKNIPYYWKKGKIDQWI